MDPKGKEQQVQAASFFLARAQDSIEAAEQARSEDAASAHYKQAETWLYMAGQCLNPDRIPRPESLDPPAPRVQQERRSFGRE